MAFQERYLTLQHCTYVLVALLGQEQRSSTFATVPAIGPFNCHAQERESRKALTSTQSRRSEAHNPQQKAIAAFVW